MFINFGKKDFATFKVFIQKSLAVISTYCVSKVDYAGNVCNIIIFVKFVKRFLLEICAQQIFKMFIIHHHTVIKFEFQANGRMVKDGLMEKSMCLIMVLILIFISIYSYSIPNFRRLEV